jgi:hypothetical protein
VVLCTRAYGYLREVSGSIPLLQSVYPAMVVAAQLVADGYSMCWFVVFVLKQPSLFKSRLANRGIALEDPCRLSDIHLSVGIKKRAVQSLSC